MTSAKTSHTNALIHATSPYLLQHAHNPVDWHEWGPAALRKAKDENKPIFLSIGYSACHWCHVMAHESFESEEIAAILNKHFVNIKVDREERPDLDDIYMQATMMLNNGQGGWPMSVWLTPDLKPFFAGTYFPPDSRWGRPGFGDLCERIAGVWRERPADIERDAATITKAVSESLTPARPSASVALDVGMIDTIVDHLTRAMDDERGGLLSGQTNKFPPSMTLDLMMRSASRAPAGSERRKRIMEKVDLTLTSMANGGIRDHLAGGFCRYSTDREWHVPHFEKMLYDQALVSRAYVNAYLLTADPLYADVAREIYDYVLTDLQSPGGGFYSARDADSEGVEGKFYVWTRDEIMAALDQKAGALFCDYYDVRPQGNWSDPHAPGEPKNVLRIERPLESVADSHAMTVDAARESLRRSRETLTAIRAQRVPPGLDDKILCEWNGLMISSLAFGGAALDEPRYVDAAVRAGADIFAHQARDGDHLLRARRGDTTTDVAFLTDYASMIEASLELYEATFDRVWFDRAAKLNDATLRRFHNESNGAFYFTPDDHEALITRAQLMRDGATPSGASTQLMNLLRLSVMTGDEELRKTAERLIEALGPEALNAPGASEKLLQGVEFALVGPTEIAFVGDPTKAATQKLLRAAREVYTPNRVMMLLDPRRPEASPRSPLLQDRTLVGDGPAAYVCRNYACQKPETTPAALGALLR